jgi:cell division protein FtsB
MNNNGLLDAIIGFLFGAGGVSVLNWLLRRRETEADIIAKQQDVIDSLWMRIDALQKRVQELEEQVARIAEEAKQLRRLLDAYERRFGRRFRIAPGGKVIEVVEQGGDEA